jgi:hypothetical protein
VDGWGVWNAGFLPNTFSHSKKEGPTMTDPNNQESDLLIDFMVSIHLPPDPSEEFIHLIPAQRAMINKLMEEGVITSECLSTDRTLYWATIRSKSETEVADIIARFPMASWMHVEIHQLMFRNAAVSLLPPVSMN